MQRWGEKRATSEHSDDEPNLEFPDSKRRKNAELPEEFEEGKSPVYPLNLPRRRWPDEGP